MQQKIKSLTLYLFLSGTINILLMAFVVFLIVRERPPTTYFEHKPKTRKLQSVAAHPSNAALVKHYISLPYDELLPYINKTRLVEDGYSERDLAIGVLVTFHDFDLEKAMQGHFLPKDKQLLVVEGGQKVLLFPGLQEEQYKAIEAFTKSEKWPFKSKGLFLLLKGESKEDPSLQEAFFLSNEFQTLQRVFKTSVDKETLLQMVLEGEWGLLASFYEQDKQSQDLSDDTRQKILLGYLKSGSKTAGSILLKTDLEFSTKRLSDPTVQLIIQSLAQNDATIEKFLSAIANGPRSSQVKALAQAKYKELIGKDFEPLISRSKEVVKPLALSQTPLPKKITTTPPPAKPILKPPAAKAPTTKKLPPLSLYISQEGDTLWKVAKRFKVSLEDLKKENPQLTDHLKPGTHIKIRQKKS